jgi:pimeloyl-ACP methyl ester carboxylesterase
VTYGGTLTGVGGTPHRAVPGDDIPCEVWGTGTRVVLVHGSLATGPLEWEGQRPLVDDGYQLVVPTRRAYVSRPVEVGEDFVTDGADVAPLLGDGAHLVGHSYGGLAAMVAAASRPDAVRSLVLAEAPTFDVVVDDPDVARLRAGIQALIGHSGEDREFLASFLAAVGTAVEEFPPELVDELVGMVPAVRRGRRPWQSPLPLDAVAAASYPVLVVSGNHHPAFTAMADGLARRLAAEQLVVEGAGHEMQMVAEAFNAGLRDWWGRAAASPA